MHVPEIQYARSGDVSIAYQTFGDGPIDLVYVPGFISNVETSWEDARFSAGMQRLGELARVVWFDKRGTGLSDGVAGAPDLETRMDDVRAVMDAARVERAALMGVSEGGPMSIVFAATYPGRVLGLVLYSTFARVAWAPDYPAGESAEEWERSAQVALSRWGTLEHARDRAQDWGIAPDDEDAIEALARRIRSMASPGAAAALFRMNAQIDVRDVVPAIRVPTLVMARRDANHDASRDIAAHIAGSRFVELPGTQHIPWAGDTELMLSEIERFLASLDATPPEPDRVLTTVLFTDVVGSTAKAAELGDSRWRDLVSEHHVRVRGALTRFRGNEIETAGDGFFASFDGPARAIRCACAISDAVAELGLEVRAGVHTGECEQFEGKVGGIAVHIGARVASLAAPGEVLVSQTVKDLVAGSQIAFEERGSRELKGVPGEWRLFAVRRDS